MTVGASNDKLCVLTLVLCLVCSLLTLVLVLDPASLGILFLGVCATGLHPGYMWEFIERAENQVQTTYSHCQRKLLCSCVC